MARAKRTDRAEARRRHRAATADLTTDETLEAEAAAGQPRAKAPSSGPTKTATGTPERIGFMNAFRLSFRPVNVRKDIAALPWIATHTHALWIPVAITIGATVLTAVSGATDTIAALLFTYFVMFPAIGSMFIVGFLAPRASWLLGVIVGIISAVCYIVLGANNRLPTEIQVQWNVSPRDAVITSLIYSALFGAFFASGAAWYRRFLALSSPNRGNRRQSQNAKAKPGDGRTRAGSTQKASAKR